MIHAQTCISLKGSCRNRLNTQVCPSFLQKSFLINHFTSSGFVDYLFANYDNQSYQSTNFDPSPIINPIAKTYQAFEEIKDQNDGLEDKIIQEPIVFGTKEDNQDEELKSLKVAMENCHKKIQKGSLDSKLIEDFVSLLKTFEYVKNKKDAAFTRKEKIQETTPLKCQTTKIATFRENLDSCFACSGTILNILKRDYVLWMTQMDYINKVT